MRSIILSIQPKWLNKIRSGTKRAELRKSLPANVKTIYVYETKPVSRIVGILHFSKIIKDDIYSLYDTTCDIHGATLDEYLSYFKNNKAGYAIIIDRFEEFNTPIKIKNAPQNFIYYESARYI